MSDPRAFRVFLSAVTDELGPWRADVAKALRRKELEVRDQDHFRLGGGTLLEHLRDYIRQCDAVILLVGERCGSLPSDEHVAALGSVPAFEKYRTATGQPAASYTQWEFLLAKHFGKPAYTFFLSDGISVEGTSPESPELRAYQQKYRDWIKASGQHRTAPASRGELVQEVLLLPFPDLSQPQPISLPYPSLGTLFKGRAEFLGQLRKSLQGAHDGRATAIVGKAVHGLGASAKRGWRLNMPGSISTITRRCCSSRPIRPKTCAATWPASPDRWC